MKILKPFIFIHILLLLGSCVYNHQVYLAENENNDDYGIGGTGIVAQNSGLGATGIIGEITGFGSIFVNGIEVEHDSDTIISINGRKVLQHAFKIGEVVEILTQDDRSYTQAVQINVRHEVIGPISNIDLTLKQLIILNQNILFDDLPANIQVGDFMAISGFRDSAGKIHATYFSPARPGEVLLRGYLDRSTNQLRMHGIDISFPAQLQTRDNNLKLRGTLKQGKITVTQVIPNRFPALSTISTWIIQGFPAFYGTVWNDNNDLKKISGQSKPVIFKVRNVDKNTPPKIELLPRNLPEGATLNGKRKRSDFGNKRQYQLNRSYPGSSRKP